MDNAKVGLLVVAGVIFLVLTLYMIGKNRNLLGSTFTIKAVLSNVNGLVAGNNVRLLGMDVGTVESITVANDTAIIVTMVIDEKMKPYIKKNAIASIGTDGLMGNKLININSEVQSSETIDANDFIQSRKPVETDEMLRTLNTTNNNIERITSNLYEISVKLNRSESLWMILSDTVIAKDLRVAVRNLRTAGGNTADATAAAKQVILNLKEGNGVAYKLFTDTTLSNQLSNSLAQIEHASSESYIIMKDLKGTVSGLKQGDGTAGLLLTDTVLRQRLFKSSLNIEQGTDRFNENMEALKSNFLFRKYFKKLEREKQEASKRKIN